MSFWGVLETLSSQSQAQNLQCDKFFKKNKISKPSVGRDLCHKPDGKRILRFI